MGAVIGVERRLSKLYDAEGRTDGGTRQLHRLTPEARSASNHVSTAAILLTCE